MSILFKAVRLSKPGVKGGTNYQWYPRICKRNKVTLDTIATLISEKCTLRRADVYAALVALTDEIPELLINNNSVQLGDLGTFSLHISGNPSATKEAVNETKIKETRLAYRPGTKLKRALRNASYRLNS